MYFKQSVISPIFLCYIIIFSPLNISISQANVSVSSFAASWLVNNYNSTTQLCPNTWPGKIYWICSDNLLAYYALKNYNPTISNAIKSKLMWYASVYNLPIDSNGLPISYKHEPIIGDILPTSFNNTIVFTLSNSSGIIVEDEINNGSETMGNWMNYADLLAYKGMSYLNQNNSVSATFLYDYMLAMWDGYGFADTVFKSPNNTNKEYATYKLALFIILRERLGLKPNPIENTIIKIIKLCQDGQGGIITGYTKELKTIGVPNTETTSLVVIANVEMSSGSENVGALLLQIGIAICIIIAIVVITKIVIIQIRRRLDRTTNRKIF